MATKRRGAKPLMVAAVGGRGTGKSAWARQWLEAQAPPRLLVWDLMAEHEWAGPALSLPAGIRAMQAGAWRVRIVPDPDEAARAAQFDLWCRAAMAAGDCTAYAEELAFVTRASWAPPGWRKLCLLGRHAGVTILGTSQRPAQVDKEFFGNLDLIHCGRQTSEADAKTMASLLGVRWQELQGLPDLHWIERRAGDVQPSRGVLTFGPQSSTRPSKKASGRSRSS